MANKSDRAAMWMAISTPHDNLPHWLNISFRAPQPIIKYDKKANEIVTYPVWVNSKIKAILIAQTVKNWMAVISWFETGNAPEDNDSAIYFTRGLAIENELAIEDDLFIENETEPLVSVFCGWSKPKPAGVKSELAYHGSPYTFTVTSSTVPGQLVSELEAMAMAHKALMKNEPDSRTTPQPEQQQTNIHPNTPTSKEMAERGYYHVAGEGVKNVNDAPPPQKFTPPVKSSPINNEEKWQGILSKNDEKAIEASDVSVLWFEVERSQWKSGKSKAGNDYTLLEFFGRGCQYAYPFNIWPDTRTDYIDEGFDLLPEHGGHMTPLVIKVTIARPDTGKIYWNIKEVYTLEDTHEAVVADDIPF